MKFKNRRTSSVVVCGSAPVTADLSTHREYRAGEQVSLRPEPKGLHDELNAVVLGMNGDRIRVRALHGFYLSPTEQLVKSGSEFEVAHDEVHHVILP